MTEDTAFDTFWYDYRIKHVLPHSAGDKAIALDVWNAGAAWGAAARQRHDEQVCDRVGAGYQALGHQRGVDACIDCKEEIHASQQMPERQS